MGRKTIKVEEVLEIANDLLSMRDDTGAWNDENRKGITFLLESILQRTDNYAGFNYVDWLNGGHRLWVERGSCEATKKEYFGPEHKRVYHKHRLL